MLAQEPGVRLGAGQTGAVDAGLLARAHADGLPVVGIADGVGLGVLEGDQRDDQVDLRLLRQLLVFRDDVLKQRLVDLEVVTALLEGDAEDLLGLLHGRDVALVDGDDVVGALALLLEDLQRLRLIARGDHAVADLAGDQLRGGHVAHVGERDPVAEGAHAVRAAGAGVGAGQRGVIQARDVVHKAGLLQVLRQHAADGGGGRRDVLEGGHGAQAGRLLELLDQLPGVERVQEVDVARTAVEDGDGQVAAVLHVDLGWLLIRVAAVLQFKLFHRLVSFCSATAVHQYPRADEIRLVQLLQTAAKRSRESEG